MGVIGRAKFGIHLPNSGGGAVSPDSLVSYPTIEKIAMEAEELEFDSIWANEHVTLPTDQTRPETKFYEPLTLLSSLVGRTSSITLGTAIVILPFRDPFVLAKEAGTISDMSGGRFILGVGAGRFEREYAAQNKNWMERNKVMVEQIRLLREFSSGRPVTFSGKYYQCRDFLVSPFPKNLPIILGGSGELAIQRATRYCDGIMPGHITPERAKQMGLDISVRLIDRNKPKGDFTYYNEIILSIDHDAGKAKSKFFESTYVRKVPYATDLFSKALVGNPETIVKRINDYVQGGVQEFILIFADENETDFIESMNLFSSKVLMRH